MPDESTKDAEAIYKATESVLVRLQDSAKFARDWAAGLHSSWGGQHAPLDPDSDLYTLYLDWCMAKDRGLAFPATVHPPPLDALELTIYVLTTDDL